MKMVTDFIDLFLHLDKHLNLLTQNYGIWIYLILFLIVFCETGLVVTPLLPGDSLLFAAGSLAAMNSLKIELIFLLLSVAAILGDTVNYWIGQFVGVKAFHTTGRFLNKEYLDRTHKFYEKYGGKTIIFARFVPIIRTFAPFVAGIGTMSYKRFIVYNVSGAVAWIAIFAFGGYYFGNIPAVKKNFTLVIIAIIIISILPGVFEYIRHRRGKR
ncbi:MAG: DedA family protein [Nitrospinae bacterium]|nr:DedA family protein [Nitrospinota bacterium]